MSLDSRSEKYLAAVDLRLGVHGWNEGYTDIRHSLRKKGVSYNEEKLSGNIDLIAYEIDGNQRWAAQWVSVAYPDDTALFSAVFTRKPSLDDVLTARTVLDIKTDLLFGRDPEFCCYVCGHTKHWLDIEADSLEEKWARRKERYCGC